MEVKSRILYARGSESVSGMIMILDIFTAMKIQVVVFCVVSPIRFICDKGSWPLSQSVSQYLKFTQLWRDFTP
jgi:hypothetical protein